MGVSTRICVRPPLVRESFHLEGLLDAAISWTSLVSSCSSWLMFKTASPPAKPRSNRRPPESPQRLQGSVDQASVASPWPPCLNPGVSVFLCSVSGAQRILNRPSKSLASRRFRYRPADWLRTAEDLPLPSLQGDGVELARGAVRFDWPFSWTLVWLRRYGNEFILPNI